jgi:hypothetical protein
LARPSAASGLPSLHQGKGRGGYRSLAFPYLPEPKEARGVDSLLTGGQAQREVHGLQADSLLRPDLQIVYPGQHVLTDVAISHPLAFPGRRSAGSE